MSTNMLQIFLGLSIALAGIKSSKCNVIDYLDLTEPENLCDNWVEGSDKKDKCLEELCISNPKTFECQALKCKLRFPISELTNNLKQNMSRLRCIKRVCSSNRSEVVCQNLRKCDSEEKGPLGKAAYIICISKLFT